jgi:hypothetical protein
MDDPRADRRRGFVSVSLSMLQRRWLSLACFVAIGTGCVGLLGDFVVDQPSPGDGGPPGPSDDGAPPIEAGGGTDGGNGDAAPGCDAPRTACPGACVDLTQSANHCGACGHDCIGGMCDAGACAPYTVAKQPTTGAVASIATDGTRVFWSDTGKIAIEQIATDGGGALVLAPGSTANGAIGTDLAIATGVVAYSYTTNPAVGIASIDVADSGAPLLLGAVAVDGVSLTPDGTRVFYVDTTGTQSNLQSCALHGRDAGACVGVGYNGRFFSRTAADLHTMFYVQTQIATTGAVGFYLNAVGTTNISQFSAATNAASLAVDGTWAYWTDPVDAGTAYEVQRTLESSPTSGYQVVVSHMPSAVFTTDGVNVYYPTGSAINAQPVAGGPSKTLAPATGVVAMAVGGGLLVWSDGASITGMVLTVP